MRRPAGSGHWHVPTIRMVTLRLQLGRGQREAGTRMLPVPASGSSYICVVTALTSV